MFKCLHGYVLNSLDCVSMNKFYVYVFHKLLDCFSKQVHNLHLYQHYMRFLISPYSHQHLLLLLFLNYNHSSGYEVVSRCGFNLHSLIAIEGEYFFICSLAICMLSLEK